jgi:hypothetical protein
MSKPLTVQTHVEATGSGVSSAVRSKGHSTVALFVHAANVDAANDTVEAVVEVSPDGVEWAPLRRADGTEVRLNSADLTGENGYTMVHGALGQQLRVNLPNFTDAAGSDLTVDTWLMLGGWPGPASGVSG